MQPAHRNAKNGGISKNDNGVGHSGHGGDGDGSGSSSVGSGDGMNDDVSCSDNKDPHLEMLEGRIGCEISDYIIKLVAMTGSEVQTRRQDSYLEILAKNGEYVQLMAKMQKSFATSLVVNNLQGYWFCKT